MRSPDWFDCGCENRKMIMFEAGQFGLWHALLLAAGAAAILYVAARK